MLFPHDTKAEALGHAPLFRELSKHELGELAKATEDLEVEEGKVLTRQGDLGREFFVIVDGEVSVTKDGEEIRRLGPGDFFGEIALLEDDRRTATVTTATRVKAAVMDAADFFEMCAEIPAISTRITDAAMRRSGH